MGIETSFQILDIVHDNFSEQRLNPKQGQFRQEVLWKPNQLDFTFIIEQSRDEIQKVLKNYRNGE